MGKMDEMILVVDRDILFEGEALAFQGITTDKAHIKRIMRNFKQYKEVRRGDAEQDTTMKQPIPSVIIKRGDEVFVYKRLSAGGEARLHDQLSLTVGGHMNRINDVRDWTFNLEVNMHRELEEEVEITGLYDSPKLIGLINDDSNDVGEVHIGILYLLEISSHADVVVRETDTLEGCWIRTKDLNKAGLFEAFETWSQLATEVL